jgi:hypothetical protein
MRHRTLFSFLFLVSAVSAAAQGAVPPEWRTPAEVANFEATPSYEETIAFLRKLEARMPEMKLSFYGTSAQGRPSGKDACLMILRDIGTRGVASVYRPAVSSVQ